MAPLTIQQSFNLALQHHQAGRLQEAEKLYRNILAQQPRHAEATHFLAVLAHQVGRNDAALNLFRQTIALRPDYVEAHYNLANTLADMGKTDEAIAAYRQAIALRPNYTDAYCNLGNALRVTGRFDEAIAAFRRVIALNPQSADAFNNLGIVLKNTGQRDEAIRVLQRAISLRPNFAEAHSNLGNALMASGNPDAAIAAFRRAIALRPNYADAHNNLGLALAEKKQFDEAIAAYRKSLAHNANFSETHFNLANALKEIDHVDEAIANYQQAIALRPGYFDAFNNLGSLLRDTGKLNEAIAAYRQAIALNPRLAEAYSNLGVALSTQGYYDDAIAAFRQAIALRPDFPEAFNNLGNTLQTKKRSTEAIAAFRQAIALKPDYAHAHSNLGNALSSQGQVDDAIASLRRAIALDPHFANAHSNLVLTIHYHPAFDARAIVEEHRVWNHQHAEPLRHLIQPHSNDRTPDRRLRIGYVSADFRNHVVGQFILPLLAQHDHARFEIFCYANSQPDAFTQRYRSHADHWREIKGQSDKETAQLIRTDGIDILIDLAGHTADNRLLVFARKPAPVQVTYLGFPGTTGMSSIDYRLTDTFADPIGMTEALHTETLVRLPRTNWCFDMPQNTPAVEPPPMLKRGYVTFGTFNNFTKVTDPMLRLWETILQKVPNSRLLLKGRAFDTAIARDRVQREVTATGIDADRLDLRGYAVDQANHLALYSEMDIALDTFPYNGTQTTCDAFWMGVPVITLAGQTHVSRVGASLLSNVQLPELIASTPDEYVQIAVDLARDSSRLDSLRNSMRARLLASPLMDAPSFARDVEAAYCQMWRTWCETKS